MASRGRAVAVAGVVLLAAAVVGLWWRPWAAPAFRAPEGVADLRARLERTVPAAMRAAHVPGAAVAVVHGGRVAWVRGFGVTRAGGAPVTADTRFQVGSVSKPVTAWGVVAGARAGGLGLDVPLPEVLRPWPLPAAGPDPAGVTPRRLLSHTAGATVGGYAGVAPPVPTGSALDSLRGTGGEGPRTRVRLARRPGTGVAYAGGGYTLLQVALERTAGEPFPRWARRAVLAPLGMEESAFGALPAAGADVATGHDADGRALPDYRYAEQAAAGLVSTARDLGRFAVAVARDPRRLGTPQSATGGRYGLGMEVEALAGGATCLHHPGVNRGWYADLRVYPRAGWAVAVLTNGDGGRAVADAVRGELED